MKCCHPYVLWKRCFLSYLVTVRMLCIALSHPLITKQMIGKEWTFNLNRGNPLNNDLHVIEHHLAWETITIIRVGKWFEPRGISYYSAQA